MSEKELWFLPEFFPLIRAHVKTKTTRRSPHGRQGDRFIVPGSEPRIVLELDEDPTRVKLRLASWLWLSLDGVRNEESWIKIWDERYPDTPYAENLDLDVFVHYFRCVGGGLPHAWKLQPLSNDTVDAIVAKYGSKDKVEEQGDVLPARLGAEQRRLFEPQ